MHFCESLSIRIIITIIILRQDIQTVCFFWSLFCCDVCCLWMNVFLYIFKWSCSRVQFTEFGTYIVANLLRDWAGENSVIWCTEVFCAVYSSTSSFRTDFSLLTYFEYVKFIKIINREKRKRGGQGYNIYCYLKTCNILAITIPTKYLLSMLSYMCLNWNSTLTAYISFC